jgi:predicted lipid-binding transport protein (Tim44 family)
MDALLYQNEVPVTPAKSATNPGVSCTGVGERPKAAFTTTELVDLGRALNTLLDIASALTNRPGLHDRNGCLNAAGSRFDKIVGAIGDEYLEVMSELRDSRPRFDLEAENRSCDLLAFDLNCDQEPTGVALSAVRKAFPGRY